MLRLGCAVPKEAKSCFSNMKIIFFKITADDAIATGHS